MAGRLSFVLLLNTILLACPKAAVCEWEHFITLPSEGAQFVYRSDAGWFAATKTKVVYLERSSQQWQKACFLRGRDTIVYDMLYARGALFIATNIGLFYKTADSPLVPVALDSLKEPCYGLEKGPNSIFAAGANGIYSIKRGYDGGYYSAKILDTDDIPLDIALSDGLLYVLSQNKILGISLQDRSVRFEYALTIENTFDEAFGDYDCLDEDCDDGEYLPITKGNIFAKGALLYFTRGNRVFKLDLNNASLGYAQPVFAAPSCIVEIASFQPHSRPILAVATQSEVFFENGYGFHSVGRGAFADGIIWMGPNEGRLYVATKYGIYRFVDDVAKIKEAVESQDYLKMMELVENIEPSINEIMERAMVFSDITFEKINDWKRRARRSPALPKISFGVDYDWDRTIADTVSTSTGFIGPDDKTVYKKSNYSFDLTWDLSELVFNDAELSIDVRSRLTTQLRDDILSQVVQYASERKMLQLRMLAGRYKDTADAFEMVLACDRLKALIDSFTGGYLTEYLRSKGMDGWERWIIKQTKE